MRIAGSRLCRSHIRVAIVWFIAVIWSERPTEETVEYISWEIVHQVPNEMVGNIFKSVLESAGFDVLLRSHEVVAHGGLSPKPQWGDILVRSDDVERAEEIVNAYIASLSDDIIENHESDLETV